MTTDTEWDEPPVQDQTFSFLIRGLVIFWKLVGEYRRLILLALLTLFAGQCLALLVPLITKLLLDQVPDIITAYDKGETPMPSVILVGVLVAATWVRIKLKRRVQEPLFLKALMPLENQWPIKALQKLLDLSIGYHERENMGKKIAKVNKGVEKLSAILQDLFWGFSPSFFYFVANIFVMFWMDWRLALTFFIPVITAVYVNMRRYRQYYPIWEEWEKKKEISVGLFCQSITNVRTVQAYVAERRERAAHDTIREDMQELDLVSGMKVQKDFERMDSILQYSFIATLVFGLYLVCTRETTVGTVTYFGMAGSIILQSLWGMMDVYTRLLRNLIAAVRMYELLNEKVEVANLAKSVIPATYEGIIAFNNVTMIYPGKAEPVLKNLSLTFFPGEFVAIVGRSGSGKSTLVSLLDRTHDVTNGSITIDGADIRNVDRDWQRGTVAEVAQDVQIFEGTIRRNITLAYPDASEEWLLEAIKAAALGDILSDSKRFPLGYNTEVGERGIKLSGGERQRVGIARAYIAILAGAKVLILDEATSSLDSESEKVIQQLVEKLRKERGITIIAIAHRLSTIYKADRICVLDNGNIVGLGTHEELLRENGLYHRLVKLQHLGDLRE